MYETLIQGNATAPCAYSGAPCLQPFFPSNLQNSWTSTSQLEWLSAVLAFTPSKKAFRRFTLKCIQQQFSITSEHSQIGTKHSLSSSFLQAY